MRIILGCVVGLSLTGLLVASCAQAKGLDKSEKLSYAIGMHTAQTIHQHHLPIQTAQFVAGFKAQMAGKTTLLSAKQAHTEIADYDQTQRKQSTRPLAQQKKGNPTMAEQFLADNKTKPGVITCDSGLQYKIIRAGHGESPKLTDQVTVNYEGSLQDGKVFDSSYTRGQPAQFPVNGVIKGWQEALQLMKTGAEWQIYIPAHLAYGAQGVPGAIPPNSLLIFKVELLSIKTSG